MRVEGSSQFKNNFFTEMCSGSEAGSYLRRIDFVYHSTLGLRVIKKKQGLRVEDQESRHALAALPRLGFRILLLYLGWLYQRLRV